MDRKRLFKTMQELRICGEEILSILSEEKEKELSLDEKYILKELTNLQGSFSEIAEEMEYLCQDIIAEGELNIRGKYYYIDNYKIDRSSEIEFILDGEWVRSLVTVSLNESYLDLFGLKIGEDVIKSRIRCK